MLVWTECTWGRKVKNCSKRVWTWQCWINSDLRHPLQLYWIKDFLVISSKRRMFVATYSTQWGWRLLARRGSCHWPVGCEPWRPDAHACSYDRCPSLPCAARCQSFGALISQHSRCYPKRNTGQFNSLQEAFRKTWAKAKETARLGKPGRCDRSAETVTNLECQAT